MLRYVEDSILNAPERYIIHGCNAQGAMGSGLAKVLFERYPNVRTKYLESSKWHKDHGVEFLGTFHYAPNDPHYVINAITQEFYGSDGKLYASYEAIEQVFTKLNDEAKRLNNYPLDFNPPMQAVAIPLIGCGLAGGDWKIVSEIISLTATEYEPVIYVPDGKIP